MSISVVYSDNLDSSYHDAFAINCNMPEYFFLRNFHLFLRIVPLKRKRIT